MFFLIFKVICIYFSVKFLLIALPFFIQVAIYNIFYYPMHFQNEWKPLTTSAKHCSEVFFFFFKAFVPSFSCNLIYENWKSQRGATVPSGGILLLCIFPALTLGAKAEGGYSLMLVLHRLLAYPSLLGPETIW